MLPDSLTQSYHRQSLWYILPYDYSDIFRKHFFRSTLALYLSVPCMLYVTVWQLYHLSLFQESDTPESCSRSTTLTQVPVPDDSDHAVTRATVRESTPDDGDAEEDVVEMPPPMEEIKTHPLPSSQTTASEEVSTDKATHYPAVKPQLARGLVQINPPTTQHSNHS